MSSHQLFHHIDPEAKYFCMIDATSRFHQVPVVTEASTLLTIMTNCGSFSYKVLPQGVCNSRALWKILNDWNARLDPELAIIKDMDDFLLHGRTLEDLEKKLEKFMELAEPKT